MQTRDEDLFHSYVELQELDKKILEQKKIIGILLASTIVAVILLIFSLIIDRRK